ncbi:hypothetical protein CALVIDRAFT_599039 [Calocera viscosa TUFC12733]|uniref:Uncharacterized protein n=1 Tax=Calocera viscosa (strain TUFC12733) TaxID=1330018 RepID=A0A167LEC8_CALVF|nr:hypothetical protein CALVIDRAFT_599039 [Calocera viscosa TUFC12733]
MSSFNVTSFPTISGGLPTKPDEAPSIIFVLAYIVLLVPTVWRTYTYRVPGQLLFTFVRLTLFVLVRIATFGLRAQEAATASLPDDPVPDTGIFIAEQILLGIGFIVLVDLMVELLKSHIWRTDVPQQDQTRVAQQGRGMSLERIVRLMHIALLVAIGLGVGAGTMYSDALTDPSKASTVKTLRVASVVISLVVAALVVLVSLLLLVQKPQLGATRTCYILGTALVLIVVPAYRLSTTLASSPTEEDLVSSKTRIEFYVLQGLMEWLVAGLLVLVDVRVWFFAGGDKAQMMLARAKGYDTAHSGSAEQVVLNGMPHKYDAPQYVQGYAAGNPGYGRNPGHVGGNPGYVGGNQGYAGAQV